MSPHTTRFPLARAGGLCSFALLALFTACDSELPTAADIERTDVATLESVLNRQSAGVISLRGDSGTNSSYIVDGITVTAVEARGIGADQISGIEFRSATPAEKSQLRVTTGPLKPGKYHLRTGPTTITTGKVLFLIDGVRVDQADMNALQRNDITGVEIVKGEAALKQYGQDAAGGAVAITTKRKPAARKP